MIREYLEYIEFVDKICKKLNIDTDDKYKRGIIVGIALKAYVLGSKSQAKKYEDEFYNFENVCVVYGNHGSDVSRILSGSESRDSDKESQSSTPNPSDDVIKH